MMKATLLDYDTHDADLMVVNAARVSFDKAKTAETFDTEADGKLIRYLAKHGHWTPLAQPRFTFSFDVPIGQDLMPLVFWANDSPGAVLWPAGKANQLLISNSLWGWLTNPPPGIDYDVLNDIRSFAPLSYDAIRTGPGIPFCHREDGDLGLYNPVWWPDPSVSLLLDLPIFVARQLMRSNVGVVYNEVSRRYVDTPPEFWRPDTWRGRPQGSIKQGSGDDLESAAGATCSAWADSAVIHCLHSWSIAKTVAAPEQARTMLPVSMMTKVFATFTNDALERVLRLREDPHAQKEIQELAALIRTAVDNG